MLIACADQGKCMGKIIRSRAVLMDVLMELEKMHIDLKLEHFIQSTYNGKEDSFGSILMVIIARCMICKPPLWMITGCFFAIKMVVIAILAHRGIHICCY